MWQRRQRGEHPSSFEWRTHRDRTGHSSDYVLQSAWRLHQAGNLRKLRVSTTKCCARIQALRTLQLFGFPYLCAEFEAAERVG
jgi:hypothetical protein